MTLKVLLINPPRTHMFTRGQPRYYAEEQALLPPLGLLSIAAYLLENSDHEVTVLDMPAAEVDLKGLGRVLEDIRPDVVGVSCITNILYDSLQVARSVKSAIPSVPVVFGGYHTRLYPAETLAHPEVDALVLGAGEIAFTELVDGLARTGAIPRIPGVLSREHSIGDVAGEIQVIEDPDSLPLPARHLSPYRKYYSATSVSPPTTVLITSFGCSSRCIFCNTSGIHKMASKSPGRVAEEMAGCVDLGIREFTILDENFTQNRRRVTAIAEEILRRRLDVVWSFKARVDQVDREMLRMVRRAGCVSVHFGVESGDPTILELIRKDIALDRAVDTFRTARDEGLETTAAFMLGFPGETEEQLRKTIDFALKLDPNYVQFAVTIPLPGTELYRMAFEKGLFTEDPWREFARHPAPDFRPPGWYEIFSEEELEEFLDLAYRRFYIRPGYIWGRLRKIRSLSELRRNIRIGSRILVQR